jgi:hypothetical protein
MALIIVSLKTDNGKGSALVACTGIKKDPLLPDNRILENVQGVLWPIEGHYVRVSSWSVHKKLINHWMAGDVYNPNSLTLEMLAKAKKEGPPVPQGQSPAIPISNEPEKLASVLQAEAEISPPLPGQEQKGSESDVPDGG